MPIYEYQCKTCHHVFDALQKINDDPLTDCPECNQPNLRKLLSAPNFRLKGGGWYETDFKESNKRNLAGDSGKPETNNGEKKTDKAKEAKTSKPDKSNKTTKKVSDNEK
ncbi:MAG: zinc ribbon domain-containing protein [Pseudomonadota bacterium]|nr:zinc ribbon domain-containing protein [Pseudomonadota bacterium]